MKQYVLVAGVDYDRLRLDFRILTENRRKRLVAGNRAKEDLVFRTFDVREGSVTTRAVTYPGGRKRESVRTENPFRPATAADFNRSGSGDHVHGSLKDGLRGLTSVTDVYEAVRAIGTDAPGTLHELSFFSHGWHGGPVLLNSHDNGEYTSPSTIPGQPPTVTPVGAARDPDDFDPRAPKDFQPPTMDAVELGDLRAAFHPSGISWNWGCTFPRVFHEILSKLEKHRDYRRSGLSDSQVFEFTNFQADHVRTIENWLRITIPDARRVVLTFGDLKRLFCKATTASYNHYLATATEHKVYASAVGTYSSYDTGPLGLMHVVPQFTAHFAFYQNYLRFTFDPEGRHYGTYLPTFSCRT